MIKSTYPKFTLLLFAILPLIIVTHTQTVNAFWNIDSSGRVSVEGEVLGVTDNPNSANANPSSKKMSTQDMTIKDTDTQRSRGKSATNLKVTTDSNEAEIQTVIAKNDKLKVKVKSAEPTESTDTYDYESETDAVVISDSETTTTTTIRSKGNAAYVIRNKIAAQTHFPLQVNLETNELMVTTPKGTKIVTVLPDKAVQNMLAANVLDQLGGKGGLIWLANQPIATDSGDLNPDGEASGSSDLDEDPSATDSGDLDPDEPSTESGDLTPDEPSTESGAPVIETEADQVIDLVEYDGGTLAYEMKGSKFEKFLGMKRVELKRTVLVSAETGELLNIQQDFRTRLVDFFSF